MNFSSSIVPSQVLPLFHPVFPPADSLSHTSQGPLDFEYTALRPAQTSSHSYPCTTYGEAKPASFSSLNALLPPHLNIQLCQPYNITLYSPTFVVLHYPRLPSNKGTQIVHDHFTYEEIKIFLCSNSTIALILFKPLQHSWVPITKKLQCNHCLHSFLLSAARSLSNMSSIVTAARHFYPWHFATVILSIASILPFPSTGYKPRGQIPTQ